MTDHDDHDDDPTAPPSQSDMDHLIARYRTTKTAATTVRTGPRRLELDSIAVVLLDGTVSKSTYTGDGERTDTIKAERAWLLKPDEAEALTRLLDRRHDPDAAQTMLFDTVQQTRVVKALEAMIAEAKELFPGVPDNTLDLTGAPDHPPSLAPPASAEDPVVDGVCPDCRHGQGYHDPQGGCAGETEPCDCVMSRRDISWWHDHHHPDGTERVTVDAPEDPDAED